MKKLFIILVGISIVFLSGLSCTKDITLNPISSISSTSFWKTESDVKGALAGMYARFRGVTNSELFLFGEGRGGNLEQGTGIDFSNTRLIQNTLDATVSGPDWINIYTVIHDANLILKYTSKLEFKSEVDKNNILAQAHTMRAFLYFMAVRTWGEVPLVTQPTESSDSDIINKERAPVAMIFALIKKDIEDAGKLFQNNNYPAGRNMWSKPALNALKADVFLWTGKRLGGGNADFNVALTSLNEIESSDVVLLSNFETIFNSTNKGNKEIIMAIEYKDLQSSETFMYNLYQSNSGLPSDISPEALKEIGQLGGDNYWKVQSEVRAKFTTDDTRKKASYVDLNRKDNFGNYTQHFTTVQKKFQGVIIAGVRRFYDDVVIYRYADILLLKAEAKNALGQDPSADINKVRQRAYGTNYSSHVFVSGTKEANDAEILNERCIELLFEGKRWWDVVRFGKAFELVPELRKFPGQNYRLLFPISINVLSLESKVKQNPGY